MSELRFVQAKSKKPPYTWNVWDIHQYTPTCMYDKNTLCMFTGMSDTKDKKIWENDVVEFLGKEGKIVYCNGAFGIEYGFALGANKTIIFEEE